MPKHRINENIRIPSVRLIAADGSQAGIVDTLAAVEMAQHEGLDLVEIAPNADPPVCKIMDYGKFLYQQSKKDKAAKVKQHTITVKGVRLTPKISQHDLETKAAQARDFLEDGHKVKAFVIFRGRMITHKEFGQEALDKFLEILKEIILIEQEPKMDGPRSMSALLAPKKTAVKKKTEE
ncbi:MAG: translation initiation factor IF-3 [bacterium]|nr:translation initiation factor IF-3 [bacterium]